MHLKRFIIDLEHIISNTWDKDCRNLIEKVFKKLVVHLNTQEIKQFNDKLREVSKMLHNIDIEEVIDERLNYLRVRFHNTREAEGLG